MNYSVPVLFQNHAWYPDPPDHRDCTQTIVTTPSMPRSYYVDGTEEESDLLASHQVPSSTISSSSISVCGVCEYLFMSEPLSAKFISANGARLFGNGGPLPIRHALKAVKRFGAPIARLDSSDLPTYQDSFLYAAALSGSSLQYHRWSLRDQDPVGDLKIILLQAASPIIFGFTLTAASVATQFLSSDRIDNLRIDLACSGSGAGDRSPTIGSSTGILRGYSDRYHAFHFRSCWGNHWGNQGFGWLSYEVVRRQLIGDLWSLTLEKNDAQPSLQDQRPVTTDSPQTQTPQTI